MDLRVLEVPEFHFSEHAMEFVYSFQGLQCSFDSDLLNRTSCAVLEVIISRFRRPWRMIVTVCCVIVESQSMPQKQLLKRQSMFLKKR